MLVSYNMKSLFTNVPMLETVDIIKKLLALAEIAEMCLCSTYFQFNRVYYAQVDVGVIGLPLLPVSVNLYTRKFDTEMLDTAEYKLIAWF